MLLRELERRRVAVWGAGKEGLAAIKALRTIFPAKPLTVLNDSPLSADQEAALAQYSPIAAVSGRAVSDALGDFEVVIKSPSVCPYRSDIQKAVQAGTVFTSGVQLWFDQHPEQTAVVVTGTKGKTTTTRFIAHLLRRYGKAVVDAGNVGTPLLDYIDTDPAPDVWVIELSSYQLAGVDIRPRVAVLLNLYPEHLDWHGTVEAYYRDKLNVFKNAKPGTGVVNWLDANSRRLTGGLQEPVYFNHRQLIHFRDSGIWDGDTPLLERDSVPLQGNHNLSNVCAALTAIRCLGVSPDKVVEAIPSFEAAPHRLQPLGEVDGVLYVDDSISTIPESAIAALDVHRGREVTLLVGGHDRGLDYSGLIAYLLSSTTKVIAMPDSGRRIAEGLRSSMAAAQRSIALFEVPNLEEAVQLARRITPPGGVVLLSPAAPSYGAFSNYAERGDRFRSLSNVDRTQE